MELKKEDLELVNNVREDNCQDSLKELINRHSALCYNVYQKYGSTLSSSGVFFDDVVKEKDYVIYKSAMSYNPDRNTKFSTWVGNHARYHCLNLINQNQKYVAVNDSTLNYFIENNNIPHIIFHGPICSGKKTILDNFINIIYWFPLGQFIKF